MICVTTIYPVYHLYFNLAWGIFDHVGVCVCVCSQCVCKAEFFNQYFHCGLLEFESCLSPMNSGYLRVTE